VRCIGDGATARAVLDQNRRIVSLRRCAAQTTSTNQFAINFRCWTDTTHEQTVGSRVAVPCGAARAATGASAHSDDLLGRLDQPEVWKRGGDAIHLALWHAQVLTHRFQGLGR
jgi:hypothetical protein